MQCLIAREQRKRCEDWSPNELSRSKRQDNCNAERNCDTCQGRGVKSDQLQIAFALFHLRRERRALRPTYTRTRTAPGVACASYTSFRQFTRNPDRSFNGMKRLGAIGRHRLLTS